MTPEGVMMDEWYDFAEEAGGWRLDGIVHLIEVVLSKATSWVGESDPELEVEPPCRILDGQGLRS
jgi:hypothetical protein